MTQSLTPVTAAQRLLSLDFLRGLIMVLLMISSTGLYDFLYEKTTGHSFNVLVEQFVHHPWNGLRFWDLVQPFLWGLGCLIVGYGLDWAGTTPIIKRIATTSFTIVSLGWVLWFLAFSYWWIEEIPKFIIAACCIFALEWVLCYFLYKKKIFFKV